MDVIGFGTPDTSTPLGPVTFTRPDPAAGEVAIEIRYCGVCHSDLHQCNDDWDNTVWPCVPGHEIVGVVTALGDGVDRFAVGDTVGVGCMVKSCQECDACRSGEEQYCSGPRSCTLTYNGPKVPDGTNSYGGYSDQIVVRQEFVLAIPDELDPMVAAPILCAGVTTYSPMKHFGLESGQHLAVAGVGGLGHMAIQIGKALGARVTALTTSAADKRDAIEDLGADAVVDMGDDDALAELEQTVDLLIDTIPYPHDIAPYIDLMKPNTTLVVVGNMMEFEAFSPGPLVFHRIAVSGSLIGGVANTQEVLDLCAEHGIAAQVERIDIDDVNTAFERMKDEDVRFRHVIDMTSLRERRADYASKARAIDEPTRGEVTAGA